MWIFGGLIALAVGVIGIILPLLPTTPFLLLAAYCFTRGSERLNNWLITHTILGPPIINWRRYGAISAKAKRWALIVIAATPPLTWLIGAPLWALVLQIAILITVSIFILTRPRPPQSNGRGNEAD